jgi:CelD/BcsL family acetyltransferase involved in cellulose biosynthesis/polysaccharide pyruvyl transferase WcaK-like protein
VDGPCIVYVGGWATHRHVGDDAILRTHLAQLAAHLPHARPVVLGSDPGVLRERFGVDTAPDLRGYMLAASPAGHPPDRALLLRRLGTLLAAAEGRVEMPAAPGVRTALEMLRDATALVDLGAGSLTSAYHDVLWSQAAACAIAASYGVPRIVSGVTVGPVDDVFDRIILGRILRGATHVTVRDRTTSAALAEALGARDVVEAIDDAVALRRATDVESADTTAPYAVLCAAPQDAESLAPAVAALHADHGIATVALAMDFFPGLPDGDGIAALHRALPDPDAMAVLDPVPPDEQIAELVAGAAVVVGSRYHLAVFAAAAGTPAVLQFRDEYTRVKAQGLASLAPGVTPIARTDGREALVEAVTAAVAGPRPQPIGTPDPLPAVAKLITIVAPGADPDAHAIAVEPIGDLQDARALWEQLGPTTGNPFATWMYADLWWRHLGNGRPLYLSAVRVDGDIVALLPLFAARDGLRFVGHIDADLLGPIGAPIHHPAALRALRDWIAQREARMIADDLSAGSALWLGGTVVRRTPSPVVDLPEAGFDALLQERSALQRRDVRRHFKRLTSAHDVRMRTADPQTLERDLDTLFALHRARFGDASGTFAGPRGELHRDLARRALELGWLRLRVLELDQRPVAATYGLRVGPAEWWYQSGRDPAFERASVGSVLLAAAIRAACEEGAREFRMLRGDEAYKSRWATRDAALETVLVDRT